jgi:hypothetical protein
LINGIGFIGKMRSGKDEAATYIKNVYGGRILKFADPLYEIEAAIFNIVGVPIPEDKAKRRRLLQFIGTEWGRQTIDDNIWANIMDNKLSNLDLLSYPVLNLVTDVRFPNEIEVLRKHNFKIIRIHRPESFRIMAGATNIDHPSETSLDNYNDCDAEIFNNVNSLESYHKTVNEVFTSIQNETLVKGMRYVTS